MIENNWNLAKIIINDAAKALNQSINDIWNNLNNENRIFFLSYKDKLKSTERIWKENESLISKYKETKDLKQIREVSSAFNKEDELKKEVQDIIEEAKEQSLKNELGWMSFVPIKFQCSWKLSELYSNNEANIVFCKNSKQVIQLSLKRSGVDQAIISMNFIEIKFKAKYFLKLELEENKCWELNSKEIQEFDLSHGEIIINKLNLGRDLKLINNITKLNFKIFVWKIDETTKFYREKILSLILDRIWEKAWKQSNIKKDNNKNLTDSELINEKLNLSE